MISSTLVLADVAVTGRLSAPSAVAGAADPPVTALVWAVFVAPSAPRR